MNKIILVVIASFFSMTTFAKDAFVDAKGFCPHPDSHEGRSQFVVSFYATEKSVNNKSPGHAYITLSAPKNDLKKD
jgi:hypothetical protein